MNDKEVVWLVVFLFAIVAWIISMFIFSSVNNSLRNQLRQYDPVDPRYLPPDSWKEVLTSIKPVLDTHIEKCPFCGEAAELKWWWIGISVRLPRFNVKCKSCTANAVDSAMGFETPIDAMSTWNSRG